MSPTVAAPPFDSLVPASFRAFLYAVGEIERRILGILAEARADVRPPAGAELRQELEDLLARQADAFLTQGRDPQLAALQQARHLMASIADAVFQGFEWWGRKAWLERPLAADHPPPDGVEVGLAAQLEQLLASEPPDPELAQIYLLALAADVFAEPEAASYRRRLLAALYEPYPELANEPDRLFPEAYRRRRRRGPALLLPPVRTWLAALVVVVATLLAVSAPLWQRATEAARQAVEAILSAE